MDQKPKKRIVGYVLGVCSRHGGDKERLIKFDNEWFCPLCLRVYKDSLLAPRQLEDEERQRERFNELIIR